MLTTALRNMEQHEFAAYREYFVNDYGHEIASNYNRSLESSLAQAASELEESFPQGVPSPDNHLMCIEQTKKEGLLLAGYLWYTVQRDPHVAFIHDFFVFEQYRGKGYGKASMAALETTLSNSGVSQIRLRVAHSNQRALKLYQALGFGITGINMAKSLGC